MKLPIHVSVSRIDSVLPFPSLLFRGNRGILQSEMAFYVCVVRVW